ncbi:hypothetical protein [Flavobacterium sp.]|uniref:hypothetical protein n=1 Tax=Flavobacterium sp. TaxID=239 RepID=UPI002BBB20F0|nr:hypothetical protein [Flavobacterium sp.]HSD06684.1 hypothetical protein [Flavobacterium sp.]
MSIFLLLLINISFSQDKKEITKLKNYSFYLLKSYHTDKNWSIKYKLLNGLVQEEENFRNDNLASIQKNIYDKKNNKIESYLIFKNMHNDNKMDTLSANFFKYDNKNRLIELKHVLRFSITKLTDDATTFEIYSDFDKQSNAKTISRYDQNRKPVYKENREFDNKGNLVKEVKTELEKSQNNESAKIINTETCNYKYDKYNNVIELKRSFDPKKVFPIAKLDGLTIYETENYEYEYNEIGLWLKKYVIIEGKKRLIEERSFSK